VTEAGRADQIGQRRQCALVKLTHTSGLVVDDQRPLTPWVLGRNAGRASVGMAGLASDRSTEENPEIIMPPSSKQNSPILNGRTDAESHICPGVPTENLSAPRPSARTSSARHGRLGSHCPRIALPAGFFAPPAFLPHMPIADSSS
jgi:hypothetical protein